MHRSSYACAFLCASVLPVLALALNIDESNLPSLYLTEGNLRVGMRNVRFWPPGELFTATSKYHFRS